MFFITILFKKITLLFFLMYFVDKILIYFGLQRIKVSLNLLEQERKQREEFERKLSDKDRELIDINRKLEVEKRKIEEIEELSGILLEERDSARKQTRELSDLLSVENPYALAISRSSLPGRIVERFLGLSKSEAEFIIYYIPKMISERNSDEKIKYKRIHADPKRLLTFIEELSELRYVHEIHTGAQIYQGVKKTSFKSVFRENGIFFVKGTYVLNNFGKEIFVHTTARNEKEAGYIRDFLNCIFE